VLPSGTDLDILDAFQRSFPHYEVVEGINEQPHALLAAARVGFRRAGNLALASRNRPVRAVGASLTELRSVDRLVHNCAPILTGRDHYRHLCSSGDGGDVFRAWSCESKFQDCVQRTGTRGSFGCDVWSFFSAHDISPNDFIREMARSGSDTAIVALHLPFPLLDRRVKSYNDTTLGIRYEVENGQLLVYHYGEHSAGYVHDFETVYAWMSNLPIYRNAHVQAETVSKIGTAVLLKLTIGQGAQEVTPQMWSTDDDAMYILPELLDRTLRRGDADHFAVPARRFEQLVAFVSSLLDAQRDFKTIVTKVRGMMAEIRVGKFQVEPRWQVTIPQMYSLVHHAILANQVYSASTSKQAARVQEYYERVQWRNGAYWQRSIQGICDMASGRKNGESDPANNEGAYAYLFRSTTDHTHTYNPYQRAGLYRLAALDRKFSDTLPYKVVGKTFWGASLKLGALMKPVFVKPSLMSYFGQPRPRPLPPVLVNPANVPLPPSTDSSTAPAVSETEDSDSETMSTVSSDAITYETLSVVVVPAPPSVPDPQPPTVPSATRPVSPVVVPPVAVLPDPLAVVFQPPEPETLPLPDPTAFEVTLPRPAPNPRSVTDHSDKAPEHWWKDESDPEPEVPPVRELYEYLSEVAEPAALMVVDVRNLNPARARTMKWIGNPKSSQIQHPADQRFMALLGAKASLVWPTAALDVPCPSTGAASLVIAAIEQTVYPVTKVSMESKPTMYGVAARLGTSESQASTALRQEKRGSPNRLHLKTTKFARAVSTYQRAFVPMKSLLISGPPMSAKSAMVRAAIKAFGRRVIVYVPSKDLVDDYKRSDPDFASLAVVVTRQTVLERGLAKIAIIDEVFKFTEFELRAHIYYLASIGVTFYLFIGDPFQGSSDCVQESSSLFHHRIQMHTSLGMPRDSHTIFTRLNHLNSDWYTTTSDQAQSIFVGRVQVPKDVSCLRFKFYKETQPEDVSATVGSVQGVRSLGSVLYADAAMLKVDWLICNKSASTVAFTRHKKSMLLLSSVANGSRLVANLPLVPFVKVDSNREAITKALAPNPIDDLVVTLTPSPKMKYVLAEMQGLLSRQPVLEGHVVRSALPDLRHHEIGYTRQVIRLEIEDIAASNANFALPEPAEMDFIVDAVHARFKFQEPGPPVQRTDVRNDILDSHLLAAIHSNQSAFDNLKNLVERQIMTTKSSRCGTAEMREGELIYRRFAHCFYAKKPTVLAVEKMMSWLVDSQERALSAIVNGEPLGETSRSLTVDAEFKTQTKAKAQPSFAATLPYGQSILANSKAFNAHFANSQPLAYLNVQRLMRDGVILDYGMTDDQLSAELRRLGVAHRFNNDDNFQADVSRQDSSHTAAYLYAFILILRDAGIDEADLQFYFTYCMKYTFLSRGADATKSSLSFNLGSGDPFTLLRNDIMELCTIACRYEFASDMVIVEKGDDVHGLLTNLAPSEFATLPSIARTVLKVDYGTVGYHAGRFHNGIRYLVDPVRAFLKHFTRLSDTNVPNSELYSSYISRATDYSESEVEFLVRACQVHYPYYEADQIETMIAVMMLLRDRDQFERYSVLAINPHQVHIDPRKNCAASCVRALVPNRPPSFYRQFSSLSLDALVERLQYFDIPFFIVPPGTVAPNLANTILLTQNHAVLNFMPALYRAFNSSHPQREKFSV